MGLAQELINGFLWGWRLIMLYQLYRLLRDNQANSHPPMLSPGQERAAASSRWAQKEVVLRGSDHLSETRDLSREEVTGKKRKKEKIFKRVEMLSSFLEMMLRGCPLNANFQKQPSPGGKVPSGPVTQDKKGDWHWTGSKTFQESLWRGLPAARLPRNARTHLPTAS